MCNIKFANNNIRECAPFAKFVKIIDREHFATYGMPNSPKEAEEVGKDHPHSKDEITKQVVTSKLKGIRLKQYQAVNSGRGSGHG